MQLDEYSGKSRSDGSLTSCTYGRIFFLQSQETHFFYASNAQCGPLHFFLSPLPPNPPVPLATPPSLFPSHFPKWTAAAAEKKPVFSLTPLSQTNSFVPNSGAEFPNPGFTDPWETMEISALSFSKISGGKKGLEICICRNYWRAPKIPHAQKRRRKNL